MNGEAGLSVVVICRDEADYIDDCLAAIAGAAERVALPVQVLVVDGASRDDTVPRAATWPLRAGRRLAVDVVRCARAGYGHQRNAGVAAARHPWVAFLSADVRVGPDWLVEVSDVVDRPVDLMLGRFDLVPPPGRRPWLPALATTLYPTLAGEVVARCSTVHLLARREALLRASFDEGLAACEDKDLAHRLSQSPGWRGAGALRHRPVHLAREGPGAFLAKVAAEARALGVLDRRGGGTFPDCFGWRRAARRLAGAATLAAVAGVTPRRYRAVPVLAAAVLLAGACRHPEGWRRRDPHLPVVTQAALHSAAMLTISAGYLGGWLGLSIGRTRAAPTGPVGGTDAPGQGLRDTGTDSRREPRGDPVAPVS